MSPWGWSPYVPVAKRRANAKKEMDKLRKKGQCIQPVEIEGRTIARSFWGMGWCDHLESFSDFANRLPRGRTYARNGSVCHLEIRTGEIKAMVSGSDLYTVRITIAKLPPAKWTAIKNRCTGQVGSLLDLLQGRLSAEVMAVVADRATGLFPLPGEIKLTCSCPDDAIMCKHVAAVLYGVGHRLDTDPGLLFTLRGVDAGELISAPVNLLHEDTPRYDSLADTDLGSLFGIELDLEPTADLAPAPATTPRRKTPSTTAPAPKPAPKAKPARTVPTPPSDPARLKKSPTSGRTQPETPSRSAPKPFSPTGPNIRKLRQALELSVEDFALRIGASPATVRRWEGSRARNNLQSRFLDVLQNLFATEHNG